MRTSRLLLGLILACMSGTSVAGVIDSPLPLLDGQKVKTVFIVPGVSAIPNHDVQTEFFCTSLDTKIIPVAIEVFDDVGGPPVNDVTATNGVLNVAVGQTVGFETNDIPDFTSDEHIENVVANSGSARILSTSTKIACTALIVTGASLSPPTGLANLTILKKTQKGD